MDDPLGLTFLSLFFWPIAGVRRKNFFHQITFYHCLPLQISGHSAVSFSLLFRTKRRNKQESIRNKCARKQDFLCNFRAETRPQFLWELLCRNLLLTWVEEFQVTIFPHIKPQGTFFSGPSTAGIIRMRALFEGQYYYFKFINFEIKARNPNVFF